jgi:tetratricopeptide (TPR) repeat protein
VFRSGGYSRTEENTQIINEIVEHPLIKGKNTALSNRAATICYYTQAFCNVAKGNTSLALEKYQRVMQILDSNEDLRTDLAKRYIRTLSQIIQCLLESRQIEEAQKHIIRLEQLSDVEGFDTPDAIARIHTELVLSNLKKYVHTGKFSEGAAAMVTQLEQIKPEDSTLHKEIALRMYYYMAYLNFGAGLHSKALHWLNRVINDNENDLRQDLYGYARLFNIVVHYELGNNELLEYTIKSTARYLQKRNRDFEIEKLILDQFRKLIRLRTAASKKEQLIDFREKMNDLARNEDGRALLRYFDFNAWIRSKLEPCIFEEAIRLNT